MKYKVIVFAIFLMCNCVICNAGHRYTPGYFNSDFWEKNGEHNKKTMQKYEKEIFDWYISQKEFVAKDLRNTIEKNESLKTNIEIRSNRFEWITEGNYGHQVYVVSFRCNIKERPCCGIALGFLKYKGNDVKWFKMWIVDAENGKILYSVNDDFEEFLTKYDVYLREKYGKDE